MIYRIKEICEEKGVKVNSIAEKVGITLPALYNIVNGKMSPKIETLEKIAAALDIPMWQLFTSPSEVKEDLTGNENTITCPVCQSKFKLEEK